VFIEILWINYLSKKTRGKANRKLERVCVQLVGDSSPPYSIMKERANTSVTYQDQILQENSIERRLNSTTEVEEKDAFLQILGEDIGRNKIFRRWIAKNVSAVRDESQVKCCNPRLRKKQCAVLIKVVRFNWFNCFDVISSTKSAKELQSKVSNK
jgi:hypothetical protein